MATSTIEDIGTHAPDSLKMFQVYITKDNDLNVDFFKRAKENGYKALCLTCDTQIFGKRLKNERN